MFCQSSQYLRSSGGYMWRIWEPSRWIGGTWDFEGSINWFSVKLRQKFLCRTKTFWIIKFYGNSTQNELTRFHRKVKWVDSVRKQDLCVLLKWDNISWPRTLVILDNFAQWLVVNTLFLEMISSFSTKRMDSRKYEDWTCVGSHNQFKTSNMELKFESGLWVKTILNLGSEYPMERSSMWSIQIKTVHKFLQIHKKIKCHKQVSRLLQPDQRQKQNHNREHSFVQHLPCRCTKEDGSTLSHQNKLSLRTISWRKWSVFFDTIKYYSEKKMEQFNSRELNSIFEIILHNTTLSWWSLESLFDSRRRFEKEISVLLW